MSICTNCGHENAKHRSRCQLCGQPLDETIPWEPQKTLNLGDRKDDVPIYPAPQPGGMVFGETVRVRLYALEEDHLIDLDPQHRDNMTLGRLDPVSGSYPDVDLSVLDGGRRGVSRQHAQLVFHHDTLSIMDLSSTNGTYINNKHLKPYQAYLLTDGDEICLGGLRLLVAFEASSS